MTSCSKSSDSSSTAAASSLTPLEPLFPASAPIEHTHEFVETYCRDDFALPPAGIQEDIWWTLFGEPQLAKEEAVARELHECSVVEHRSLVTRVRSDNEPLENHNEHARRTYEKNVCQYNEEKAKLVAVYEEALNKSRRRDPKQMLEQLCQRCDAKIASLRPHFTEQLQQIYRQGRQSFLTSSRSIYWWVASVAVYLFTLIMFPLFSSLTGMASFLCWTSMKEDLLRRVRRAASSQALNLLFRDNWIYENVGQYNPDDFANVIYLTDADTTDLLAKGWTELVHTCRFDSLEFDVTGGIDELACSRCSLIPGLALYTLLESARWLKSSETTNCDRLVDEIVASLQAQVRWAIFSSYESDPTHRKLLAGTPEPLALRPEPPEPCYFTLHPIPEHPSYVAPAIPQWPGEFDVANSLRRETIVISGSAGLNSLDENRLFGRHAVFANGRVQPYLPFGGVPCVYYSHEPTNIIYIGGTGSGKTKHLRLASSYVLPLSTSQTQSIRQRARNGQIPKPSSFSEWSRSQTFQAIVYNAKDAEVSFLAQLGFRPGVDLDILDPCDRRCVAPDFAKDNQDKQSISQFSHSLFPDPPADQRKEENQVWLDNSRNLVELVVESFNNAAIAKGREPAWDLLDLVNAFSRKRVLKRILKYCDNPAAEFEHFFSYSGPQQDSIFMSVRTKIRKFRAAAALYREAARLGRTISIKEWLLTGANRILVLPNTQRDAGVYEPLNQFMLLFLTKLVLDARYSKYKDAQGQEQILKRLFKVDEMGNAGRFPQWEQLMTEGRDFGVNVLAAVQQLSMLRKTYGQDDMETILGQFNYRAFLRVTDPKTQEYMADICGKQLLLYDLLSFQFGMTFTGGESKSHQVSRNTATTFSHGDTEGDTITTGRTDTTGNATSSAKTTTSPRTHTSLTTTTQESASSATTTSNSHNKQHTDTVAIQEAFASAQTCGVTSSVAVSRSDSHRQHLQEQYAVHPHTFRTFPHTGTTGLIGGIFVGPTGQMWRADLEYESFTPELVCPEAAEHVRDFEPWDDERRITKQVPFAAADYERLCIQPPKRKLKRRSNNCESSPRQRRASKITNKAASPQLIPGKLNSSGSVPAEFQFENVAAFMIPSHRDADYDALR